MREERAEAEREAKARGKAARPARRAAARAGAEPSKNQVKRARNLETEIEQAEAELAALERELADPQAWNDPRSAAEVDAPPRRGEGADRGALRRAGGRRELSSRVRAWTAPPGDGPLPEANGTVGCLREGTVTRLR